MTGQNDKLTALLDAAPAMGRSKFTPYTAAIVQARGDGKSLRVILAALRQLGVKAHTSELGDWLNRELRRRQSRLASSPPTAIDTPAQLPIPTTAPSPVVATLPAPTQARMSLRPVGPAARAPGPAIQSSPQRAPALVALEAADAPGWTPPLSRDPDLAPPRGQEPAPLGQAWLAGRLIDESDGAPFGYVWFCHRLYNATAMLKAPKLAKHTQSRETLEHLDAMQSKREAIRIASKS